jgi:hypothetical protein
MCWPALGYIAMAASSVMSGVAAKQQGDYQAKMAEANAQQQFQKARDAERVAAHERDALRINAAQVLASGRVGFAGGNVLTGGGGSVSVWERDVQTGLNLDIGQSFENQKMITDAFNANAMNYRREGNAAKAKGKNELTTGIVGAVGTLAGGISGSKTAAAKAGNSGQWWKY